MGQKELVFDLLEMNRISYQCGKCRTVVVFDVTSTSTQVPSGCPCCGTIPAEAIIKRCLDNYRNIYQKVLEARQQVTFQFRVAQQGEKN